MKKLKNLNLKFKLIWGGLAAVLIPMILVGGISTYTASKSLVSSSKEQVKLVADDLAAMTGIIMDHQIQFAQELGNISLIKGVVNQVAEMGMEMSMGTAMVVDRQLKGILEKHQEDYETLMVTNADGLVVSDSMEGKLRDQNLSLADRDYFQSCKNGEAMIGRPALSKVTGDVVAVVAVPIQTRKGDFGGILAAAMKFSSLSENVLSKKVGATGYVTVINSDGLILAHPRSEMNLKTNLNSLEGMEILARHIGAGESGVDECVFNGSRKVCGFTLVPQTGWTVVITQEETEFMAGVRAMTRYNLIVGAVTMVVMVFLLYLFAAAIIRPINHAVEGLKDISEGDGDLTKRLEITAQDEVGVLAMAFNTFIGKLQEMIGDITQGVDTLSESATELSQVSEKMSAGSDQTSEKAGTVAAAAEEMASNMTSVSAAMEQSSTNMNTVAAAADQMNTTITDIAGNADQARNISQSAVVKVSESTDRMNQLGRAAQSIGKVVETISDISNQVNLLSLNATIEAARAGEAGQGFAVVANEIKELAGQTSEASMDIKEKIDHIQESSSDTLDGINEISTVIKDVDQIIATIAAAVEEQSSATKEIAENISQSSAGIEEVNQNVSQSSVVVDEITRDIADVNQSAGEMADQSTQVNQSSEELTDLASRLGEMVGRFKI
ncbi:MAG: methyl-accepting chemotaxis protein [Desulfobacterales bacterium]|nr:methyl-accepting chemotaxis protein [Desulfobacterales bacterium]